MSLYFRLATFLPSLVLMAGASLPARTVSPAGPPETQPATPLWQRTLSPADEDRRNDLRTRIWTLCEEGQFVDAIPVAQECLALDARGWGEDHWESEDTRSWLNTLEAAAALPPAAQAELAQSWRDEQAFMELFRKGRQLEALPTAQRCLEVRTRCLGCEHVEVARVLMYIGYIQWEGCGDLAGAEATFRETLALQRRVHAGDHPLVDAELHNLAVVLDERGKYVEAEAVCREDIAMQRRILSPESRNLAASRGRLGEIALRRGQYTEAEVYLRDALAILHRTPSVTWRDERQAYLARALLRLAALLEARGDIGGAAVVMEEALANARATRAAGRAFVTSLETEARARSEAGNIAIEDNRTPRAWAWTRRLQEEEGLVAQTLNGLARLAHRQGKLNDAKDLFEEALKMRRTLPVSEAYVPESLGDFAALQRDLGAPDEAESLYREALEQLRDLHRGEHPEIARVLSDLAGLLRDQGRADEAESLLLEALQMQVGLLGETHPDTIRTRSNLAQLKHDQGRYEEAAQLWLETAEHFAVARLRASLVPLDRVAFAAERSPRVPLAACLARNNAPRAAWEQLEADLARGLLDALSARNVRPLTVTERQSEETLIGQLTKLDERIAAALTKATDDQSHAQAAKLRNERDVLEADFLRFERELDERYGAVAGRSYSLEQIQASLRPETALLAWVDVEGHSRATDPHGEHWACVVRHSGEPTWCRLAGTSPGNRWSADDDRLPQRVREALAARSPAATSLLAALARQRAEPVMEHLAGVRQLIVLPGGWMAGIPIEALTDRYIVSYAPSGTIYAWLQEQRRAPERQPAREARLLALGDPVFPARPGSPSTPPALPDHGALLASTNPEGAAARGGIRSGDVLLSYDGCNLSGPRDLPVATRDAEPSGMSRRTDGVPVELWRDGQVVKLTVPRGQLDIEVNPKPAAEVLAGARQLDGVLAATRGETFVRLPGTRREVEAIAELFDGSKGPVKSRLLTGAQASERALAELSASGEMQQFRFLHLATHAVMDDSVAMRSALILSQEQQADLLGQALAGQDVYAGRLSADQIAHTWKLDADLVTLSACQTALGKAAGGEGYLGFTQALFLAGARSVVASLWKADDTATTLLMIRFYENLLGTGHTRTQRAATDVDYLGPRSKVEALQEARLWLRGLSAADVRTLCKVHDLPLPQDLARGVPGPVEPADSARPPFEHPYYWAAFILNGDPE